LIDDRIESFAYGVVLDREWRRVKFSYRDDDGRELIYPALH
jgi:hypothetical protein